jgi:hypothetical protein
MGVILVFQVMAKRTAGIDLGWDPVLQFLDIQARPVLLLALGLGTPLVARDRAEDVLYLYAVRPVMPWHYALGKLTAVALPSFLLLLVPGILIAVMRQGVMADEVGTGESVMLVLKVALAALFLSAGFAGVSVGSSAAAKRARWALLIAVLICAVPDGVMQVVFHVVRGSDPYSVGPFGAAMDLLRSLFEEESVRRGVASAAVLAAYGVAGFFVTKAAVRREMIP